MLLDQMRKMVDKNGTNSALNTLVNVCVKYFCTWNYSV